jgi:hypothetical protein
MKAADRKRIRRTIEAWQPMLALTDWVITISDKEPEPGRMASIENKRDLREDVVGVPAVENLCILHELLHITPNLDLIDELMRDNALVAQAMHVTVESLIDDIARWLLVVQGNEFPVPSVA